MNHADLRDIQGANPSILFSEKNKSWQMVWGKWSNGIAYSNSTDLYCWSKRPQCSLVMKVNT